MPETRYHVRISRRQRGRTVTRFITPGGDAPYSEFDAAFAAAKRAIEFGWKRAVIEHVEFDPATREWELHATLTLPPPKRTPAAPSHDGERTE